MSASRACAAFLLATTPALASAQPAVVQEITPDLDYAYTSIDMPRGGVRALARGALSGGHRFGAGASWLTQGDVDFLLGATSGQTTVLKMRSELSLTGDFQPGDEARPAEATIGGRHRFSIRHGVGGFTGDGTDDFRDRALGADLVFEGYGDHGRVDLGATRFDVGAGRFGRFGGEAGVWLRRAIGSRQGMVLPLMVRYESARLEQGEEGFWNRRLGASTGFGVRHYFEWDYHGWVEALGVAWDRFAPGAGSSVDRIELRAVHLDDIVFRDRFLFDLGDDYLFFVRSWLGGHWLTSGDRSVAAAAFELAVGSRFPFEKADAELTIAAGREASPSAYAGRFVDRYRVETRAALESRAHGIGGDVRFVSAWQSDLEAATPYSEQLAASSSVWFDLYAGESDRLSLGIYQRAQQGVPLDGDALVLDPRWRHDIGLFVRMAGGERGGERMEAGPAGFSPF